MNGYKLKWTDVALFGGKPCSLIKVDVCKTLSGYAGQTVDLKCMKKVKDEWVEDPDQECCPKAKLKGTYDVTAPVSVTIPVLGDAQGKNGGSCIITGQVTVTVDVEGEVGQCQKKKKK